MNNLEKNKDINYWNPEWINESFYDEYLEDTLNDTLNDYKDEYTDQRYLLLSPLVPNKQKNHTINSINIPSTILKLSG